MAKKCKSIGIVAPACRIDTALADRVADFARARYGAAAPSLFFHPQCFLSDGHFAGPDPVRSRAFLEVANDPAFDAVWFARGGYGAGRLDDRLFGQLNEPAREKTYLGYSDLGIMLGRLYANKIGVSVHGPMPSDLKRDGGEVALARALDFLVLGAYDGREERSGEAPCAAFNITVLSHMVGTPHEPDLSGHVLYLEDIAEYHYRIDRSLFTIFSSLKMGALKGVRLGRCSDIPENEPAFEQDEEQIVRYWCARKDIPYLGRADIGHDVDNKIVIFG